MNRLEKAKKELEYAYTSSSIEDSYRYVGITIAHALIAIAEGQEDKVCAIDGLHQTMEKIAEQLKGVNNKVEPKSYATYDKNGNATRHYFIRIRENK